MTVTTDFAGMPFPRYPISNITPFTYRDGLTFLEMIEAFRTYINDIIVTGINDNMLIMLQNYEAALAEIIAQGSENVAAVTELFDTFTADITNQQNAYETHIQAIVDSVNNRAGNMPIQYITLTGPQTLDIDVVWPTQQPVRFHVTQDAVGGHALTFGSGIVSAIVIDPEPGHVTEFLLIPQNDETWITQMLVIVEDDLINVKHFGAVGDGVTDDSKALQRAADYARAAVSGSGRTVTLLLPVGTYFTTETVTFYSNLDASQATIRYYGIDKAVRLGSRDFVTARREFHLPRILSARNTENGGWSAFGHAGVHVVNVQESLIHNTFIQNFDEGIILEGRNQGTAYNTINVGTIWSCRRGIVIRPAPPEGADIRGWVNSNLFLNGRIQPPTTAGFFTAKDPLANAILFEQDCNNNYFLNTSVEGIDYGLYRVDLQGQYNVFANCRWEAQAGSDIRIRYRANASANLIDGGYGVFRLMETFDVGSRNNKLRLPESTIQFRADGVDADFPIPAGPTPTKITAWRAINGVNYTHDAGDFIPRQGYWTVHAQLTFRANSDLTGYREVRIMRGTTIIGTKRVGPASNAASSLTVDVYAESAFDGIEPLSVVAVQTSATTLILETTVQYCNLKAHYVP